MERRLPLAVLLSLLFVWAYTSTTVTPPEEGAPSDLPAGEATRDEGASPRAGGEPPAGGMRTAAAPVVDTGEPARTVRFDAGAMQSRWRTPGAALEWLELTDYSTSPESDEPLRLLDAIDGPTGNLLLRDLAGRYALDRVHWALEEDAGTGAGRRLVFAHRTAEGLLFRRTVRAGAGRYTFGLEIEVVNEGDERTGNLSLVLQSARGLVDEEAGSVFYGAPTALAVVRRAGEDEVVTWSGGDLDDDPRQIADDERLVAAGVKTNYFTSVLVPDEETHVRRVYPLPIEDLVKLERHVAEQNPSDERARTRLRRELAGDVADNAAVDLQLPVRRLEPGERQRFVFRVFNGPKALEVAREPGYAFLTPIIESSYGRGAFINRTLLQVLRFFHGIVGNWGVAIILLTILVKGILFPLNRRQQTSMSRYQAVMTRLKPQLDELKAKYKNNTRKFNEEQMKLMRAEGVRPPLGGCLLMFAQFPIWIGLFQILGQSIELRQSRFVFWIDDLSRPDAMPFGLFGLETINLLPILMAAATIVQMRFTQKPADPSQAQMQKIMGTIMPVIMLLFLYRYSSGLSLYIFTSSLLGIFEFQVIRRVWPIDTSPGRPSSPPPPKRKRLAKA